MAPTPRATALWLQFSSVESKQTGNWSAWHRRQGRQPRALQSSAVAASTSTGTLSVHARRADSRLQHTGITALKDQQATASRPAALVRLDSRCRHVCKVCVLYTLVLHSNHGQNHDRQQDRGTRVLTRRARLTPASDNSLQLVCAQTVGRTQRGQGYCPHEFVSNLTVCTAPS